MIEIRNLEFRYKKDKCILRNINLNINDGEFLCIIGKNGSGKSTLANLISGIIKPQKGEILIDGINTKNKNKILDLRKKVGIVFQNPENQILFNNVYDDLNFTIRNLRLENGKNRIVKALEKTEMLEYINVETYELSLGQKQRITIAGVLTIDTKYIVFDEPTTMIDSEGKEKIYEIIQNLKKQGYTIIYITNNIDEILMSDRVIILETGEIVANIDKKELVKNIDILEKHNIHIPTLVQILKELEKNEISIELKNWTIQEITERIIEKIKNAKCN